MPAINVIKSYEIWKIIFNNIDSPNKNDIKETFMVISGEAVMIGYKNAKWNKIKYEGFYTTLEEAINQINAYLR